MEIVIFVHSKSVVLKTKNITITIFRCNANEIMAYILLIGRK
jgi:hypothetical protein